MITIVCNERYVRGRFYHPKNRNKSKCVGLFEAKRASKLSRWFRNVFCAIRLLFIKQKWNCSRSRYL